MRMTVSSLLLLGLAAILILLSGVWGSLLNLVIGLLDGSCRSSPWSMSP